MRKTGVGVGLLVAACRTKVFALCATQNQTLSIPTLVLLKQSDRPYSAGGVHEDAITFEPCCRFVDEWLTVSEPEIARAMTGAADQHDERLEGKLATDVTRVSPWHAT